MCIIPEIYPHPNIPIMDDPVTPSEQKNQNPRRALEGLLWLVLTILVLALLYVVAVRNRPAVEQFFSSRPIESFDEMTVNDGFHEIEFPNGQSWNLSYEANHDRYFSGLIRHTSPIQESAFALLTFDILVTSGDYADPDLVQTSVSDHHFSWRAPNLSRAEGAINLLHTVPMNEEINQQLASIQNGDTVIIKGWDILRIEGYDNQGNYIGYWQDSGCNTTLVTEVILLKAAE